MLEADHGDYIWTFYDFVDGKGKSILEKWFNGEGKPVKDIFEVRLAYIGKQTFNAWPPELIRKLKGVCQGFFEFRIQGYRILAFWGTGKNEVTLMQGFKKGPASITDRECKTAHQRKKLVEGDSDGRRKKREYTAFP